MPEGIEARVPFKDPQEVSPEVGGLRAGMGYCGAENIEQLHQQVYPHHLAGYTESHPHGVMITREAPNYSKGTNKQN